MLRTFAFLIVVMIAMIPLTACSSGQPEVMPALVLRSPIGIQMEQVPGQVRMQPAYQVPQWSQPQIAPKMSAPSFAPAAGCSPTSSLNFNFVDPNSPTPAMRSEMGLLATK